MPNDDPVSDLDLADPYGLNVKHMNSPRSLQQSYSHAHSAERLPDQSLYV